MLWGTSYDAGESEYSNPNGTGTLTRFVAIAGSPDNPDFVWEKYEGAVPGGGRNTVYVGGHKLKLTDFLAMKPAKQDAYFSTGV